MKTIIKNFKYVVLVAAFLSAGCSTRPKPVLTNAPDRMPESALLYAEARPEYRLGYGDVIEVKFFNNNQFNETLTVRPDGRISMQVVGDIQVSRMTPSELGDQISIHYGKIIKNPEVTVLVRNFGGNQVFVLGEVESPGAFVLQREMSIIQALAQAGGHKNTARLKSIMLIRRDRHGLISAKRVDLSGPTAETLQKNDQTLQALDIVYVPKTFIANVNTFLEQAFSGIISPLDIYLKMVWWYR